MTIKKTDKPVLPALSITKIVVTRRAARPGPAPGRARRREGSARGTAAPQADHGARSRQRPATSTCCAPAEDSDLRDRAARRGGALAPRRARRDADRRRARARVRRRARGRGARGCSPSAGLLDDAADDARVTRAASARATTASCATSATSRAASLPPSEYQRRLREARVLILGVGGLGSWASYALAVLRRGRARAAGRRPWSRRATSTARSSTASATSGARRSRRRRRRSREFDSSCRLTPVARRLESVDAVREAVEGVDFVVNGADWPAHDIERWVNAACFDAGVPFITMSHSPPVARVGPLYVPGTTGCFACQERTYRDAYPALRRARRPAPRAAVARPRRSARCARSSAARWRSRRSTSSPAWSRRPRSAWRTSMTCARWRSRASPCRACAGCAVCGGCEHATSPARRLRHMHWPVHASGPKHGTWSRETGRPPRGGFAPPFRPRPNVCSVANR